MAKKLTQTLIVLFAALFTLAGAAFLVMPDSVQSVAYASVEGSGTADSPWLVGTNSATSTISGNADYENDVKAWVTENVKENEEDATTYTLHIKPTIEGAYMLSFSNYSFNNTAWGNTTYKTAITSVEFDTTEGALLNIGQHAFAYCTGLTSVTIPDSVTSIGEYAFYGCTGLTSITIPDSVTSIGGYAFYGCTGLTSVTIPAGVTSIGQEAFFNCRGLASITIPDSVTSIGQDAFAYCTGLTSVTISDSVTSIGGYAFYGCTGLTSVTIPAGVTSIGQEAFGGCTGLTSVIIGEGVTSIGLYAFENCTNITKVAWNAINCKGIGARAFTKPPFDSSKGKITTFTFGANVVLIPAYVCYSMTALTSITIPAGVTSIGSNAFYGCTGLTGDLTVPAGVTSIGGYAFYGCTGLTGDLTIPVGVTSIGDYAFSGCTGLTSVTTGEGVTSIGHSAFYGCTGLTSVTIGEGVTSIWYNAFSGCTGLTSVYYTGDVAGWCNISFINFYSNPLYYAHNLYLNDTLVENLVIPDGVTSIGSFAFSGCSSLTSVVISDSVTSIGPSAFYGCTGLMSVVIGDSVTSIGNSAFGSCTGLTSVTIPDSVTSIGNSAFDSCYGLKSVYYTGDVAGWCNISFINFYSNPLYYSRNLYIDNALVENLVIPDGVTSIGSSAFSRCSSLTSVVIPDSVTSIGSDAFYGCTGLTSVVIPDSVTSIGNSAFGSCTGLTSVTIPDSVTSIGHSAFFNCRGLTSITIPDSVTSIGEYAFDGCTGLTSVTIPDSVTSIGSDAFYGCTGLTSVTISDSVTSIGEEAFEGCTGLTSVTIPDSVTSIGRGAFRTCRGLTSITIPSSVTSIGNAAFGSCTGLTSVTIPDSVTSIGDSMFYNCNGLTSVTILDSVASVGYNAFYGCTGLTSVYYTGDVADWCNISFSDSFSNPLHYSHNLYIDNALVENLVIPDSVTSIRQYAFYGCTGLTSAVIPDSVTSIGSNAFYGCTNLKTVIKLSDLDIVAGADTYGYVAKYADKVANAKIGVNISIDASYQTGLNYYVLPEMEVAFEIDGRQYTPECTDYTVADVTYHRYSLTNVAPEDMDKTITVKFTQDGVEFTRECSVKSYLETLATNIPAYAKLTSATIAYGAAMQAYTGKEVDSANLPTTFSGTAPEATNVDKTEDENNKFTGASVKFTGNEYKLKFRYECEEGATVTATVGGEEVEVTIANGVITLEKGILPAQITSEVVVKIMKGEEEKARITYNVEDYIARIYQKSTDNNMKAVVVGMYNLYYEITQLLEEGE